MSEWRPYFRDRLIRTDAAGFVVIVPKETLSYVPIVCSVCDLVLRTSDDERSHRELGCCYGCALRWAHPRLDDWKSGWRPSQDEALAAREERRYVSVALAVD